MVDLNTLVDPAFGLTLAYATDINDNGQILVNGSRSPDRFDHAYLLTPIPEPRPLALLFCGGIAVVVSQRKRFTNIG